MSNGFRIRVVCLFLATLGCDNEKRSVYADFDSDPGFSDYEGRGSRACQEWQYSLCEYLFKTCDFGVGTREQCEQQYGGTVCISDEAALACVEEFKKGDCSNLPASCYLEAIVDVEPAIEGCNEWLNAECDWIVSCGGLFDTVETCRMDLGGEFDCDQAVGLASWFEDCLENAKNRGCSEFPPDDCDGMIMVQ